LRVTFSLFKELIDVGGFEVMIETKKDPFSQIAIIV
jgi:hypothetical protein